MQVAEFLSDLTSLGVCQDSDAALALVSARPAGSGANGTNTSSSAESDPDSKRAKDLLELHASVKQSRQNGNGIDPELQDARDEVSRVLNAIAWRK